MNTKNIGSKVAGSALAIGFVGYCAVDIRNAHLREKDEAAMESQIVELGRITSPAGVDYAVRSIGGAPEGCQTLGAFRVLNDDGKVVAIAEYPTIKRTVCKTAPGNG